jgi:hypothetical protein
MFITRVRLQDAENIMLEKSVKAIRGTAITLCHSR